MKRGWDLFKTFLDLKGYVTPLLNRPHRGPDSPHLPNQIGIGPIRPTADSTGAPASGLGILKAQVWGSQTPSQQVGETLFPKKKVGYFFDGGSSGPPLGLPPKSLEPIFLIKSLNTF